MKPVCAKCGLFFQPKRTGAYVEQQTPRDETRSEWSSYQVWSGDLYECRGCGAQVVTGFGMGPVLEHYQKDYKERVARINLACCVKDQ